MLHCAAPPVNSAGENEAMQNQKRQAPVPAELQESNSCEPDNKKAAAEAAA
jgi:hypothetical protein